MSRPRFAAVSAAVALSCWGVSAQALELKLDNGWSGSLNTTLSFGTSIRAQDPSPLLYSQGDGIRAGLGSAGKGGSNTDSGNVNYAKGDPFSSLLKLNTELSLSKGKSGFYGRARAWYDHALSEGDVKQGSGSTGYKQNAPLSDAGFDRLGQFSGAALLDAYVYTELNSGAYPLQVRLGNQVINWGESLFIQGINQVNPVDLTALRKPGTELKDAFLPVTALSANIGLGDGRSVEGFYQMKWRAANVDSCGTYFSPVEFQLTHKAGNACSTVLTTIGPSNAASIPAGLYVPMVQGRAGEDRGQFGLAIRLPVEKLDSELGLYAMKFSSRTPLVSGRSGSNIRQLSGPIGAALNSNGLLNPIPAQVAGAKALGLTLVPGVGFWEYPDDIRMFGVSASTNLAGISLAAEYSHIPNYPAQINANDLLAALLRGLGPMGSTAIASNARGAGDEVQGYDRISRSQLQVNGLAIIPRVLGSAQATVVAEAAVQTADVGDSYTGKRYGRAFIFGTGKHALYGGTAAGNPQPDGADNDGYVTDSSWGYRARVLLEYPGFAGTAATFVPQLSLSHDVSGYSVDGQFIEGRQTVGLSGRLTFNRVHNIELAWVHYTDSAKYDPFRDRDHYSISFSTSF
ncbi:MAG: hypothetical protein RLY30_1809 [Pseudomonadota bacterium]